MAIGQNPVVKHLQKHIEDGRMGLFHLVEEHDLVRPPPDGLRQHAAFVVTDIARRRADQTRDRMAFHELRHVETHQGGFIVEKKLGQGFRQFRLADPCRTEKQERPEGTIRIVQACTGPSDRVGNGTYRRILPDNPPLDFVLHLDQPLALALKHFRSGHASPSLDHGCDLFGRYRFFKRLGFSIGLNFGDAFFKRRYDSVTQLAGSRQIAFALHPLEFNPSLVQLLLDVSGCCEFRPLRLPGFGQLGRSCAHLFQLRFQLTESILGCGVALFLQGFRFNLLLQDFPIQRIQFFRFRVDTHLKAARCFIDQIDGLVRKKPVGNVSMRKRRRGDQRRIRDSHAVVQFVFLLDPAQNRDRVFDRGFGNQHRLKPSSQRRVLFDILPVFVQRRSTDAVQVSPRQRRLEQVGCIHRPFRLACANKRVHLVDEQKNFSGGGSNLREYGLQPFLELAAIFRASYQGAHVERHQVLVLKAFRDVARNNPEGQPLDDGGLAYARFANKYRIVLGPSAQHLHRAPDFLFPPDNRVDSSVLRVLRDIARIALERFVCAFCRRAVRISSATQFAYRRCQRFRRNS